MENPYESDPRTMELLNRESAGYDWLLSAIIEREIALDDYLAAKSGEVYAVDEEVLLDQYRQKAERVVLCKQLLGVEDPEPLPLEPGK